MTATHDRAALGAADLDDGQIQAMLARLFDVDDTHVAVLSSHATPVAYDVPSITTAGRFWVRGAARVRDEPRDYSIFVKHLQSFRRSPLFEQVPPEHRDVAAGSVPWRTEVEVYASALRDSLPEGLTMPRALAVRELDELSAALWLEDVAHAPVAWDAERYRRAAYLLGRLAASPRVAPFTDVGGFAWSVLDYFHGRVVNAVLPPLREEAVWAHPLVAGSFGPGLRAGLMAAADRGADLAAELASMPRLAGHGDACPGNLLPGPAPDSVTLIDFCYWHALPIGFDLGQLLVGDVQLGLHPPGDLAARDEACVAAYVEGLRAEGYDADPATVRRAHALQLMLFSGLTMPPLELLDQEPTTQLQAVCSARAAIARYCVDLLEETDPG